MASCTKFRKRVLVQFWCLTLLSFRPTSVFLFPIQQEQRHRTLLTFKTEVLLCCIGCFNPIWAGFWNDIVGGGGGALSAQVSVLEGSPLWRHVIFWNFSKNFFEPGTCLTSKETKSRNLVSVALSTWKWQTI